MNALLEHQKHIRIRKKLKLNSSLFKTSIPGQSRCCVLPRWIQIMVIHANISEIFKNIRQENNICLETQIMIFSKIFHFKLFPNFWACSESSSEISESMSFEKNASFGGRFLSDSFSRESNQSYGKTPFLRHNSKFLECVFMFSNWSLSRLFVNLPRPLDINLRLSINRILYFNFLFSSFTLFEKLMYFSSLFGIQSILPCVFQTMRKNT